MAAETARPKATRPGAERSEAASATGPTRVGGSRTADAKPPEESEDVGSAPARQRGLAWGVHAFTASGAVVGAVALLAVVAGNLPQAAILMLVALAIDSIDGTLARAVRVGEVLPRIDGRRLDDIVDFLNYVIVPVVFLVAAGYLAPLWAALPILASTYGFSQQGAKTADNFFLGFPSYWNVVAIYVWLLDVSITTSTAVVAVFSVGVFVPIKYLYPSRMPVLRRTTNAIGALWICAMAVAVAAPDLAQRIRLTEISLLYPAYYLALSFALGGFEGRRA